MDWFAADLTTRETTGVKKERERRRAFFEEGGIARGRAIASSRIFSRALRYAANASLLTFFAMSLSAKHVALQRSAPFIASVLNGQRIRPSRFLSSPNDFPLSLMTYASKHSPQV